MTNSILKSQSELANWLKQNTSSIAFVPTMGSLHEGHVELIKTAKFLAKEKPTLVLVSIFINPLQFGPEEDFKKYPRNLANDCSIAFKAGADAIWAPSIDQVFPKGIDYHYQIKVPKYLKSHLCGAERKGHFDGVATVMLHLLKSIKPNSLILGEKDWQQLIIIRYLIDELGLKIKVINKATIRNKDGLPLSSRNSYLNKEQSIKVLLLPKVLKKAKKEFREGKPLDLMKIKSNLESNGLIVEYIEIVNPQTIQPVKIIKNLSLLAAAIKCGETRIIDHVFLMNRKPIVAIDGPAGAGKSTVTKEFANRNNLIYLDTGAMYRAFTWLILDKRINPEDEQQIIKEIKTIKINFLSNDSGLQQVFINDIDVTKEIRSPIVTSKVAYIAKQYNVRNELTIQQKKIGKNGGIVAEGRDIGTTVFPDAELKIFLTASSKERAKRRAIDLEKKGFPIPRLSQLQKEIEERDLIDSTRSIAPLTKAEDAIEFITDGMNIEEVIDEITNIYKEKIPEEVRETSS